MLQKREALVGASHYRKASINTSVTPFSDDNKLSFVFVSDNNGGMRHDWWSGESYEEVLDPRGASYGSLTTFFKDHDRSVDSAVGRVEDVREEGGTIVGDVVFGTGEGEQSIYRKYKEGILTDVSIGYRINEYEVEERYNEPDKVTVTDYDIFEVSAVGIGFDAGAKKRDAEEEIELEARVAALELQFGISTQE